MKTLALALLLGVLSLAAADEFSGLTCKDDLPRRLIGRKSVNGRVQATEARHKDLGLKDLGGFMGADESVFFIAWRLCGDVYGFLLKDDLIKDVYRFPRPSPGEGLFLGSCHDGSRTLPDTYAGTLDASGKAPLLVPHALRRLDETSLRFQPVESGSIRCEREALFKE